MEKVSNLGIRIVGDKPLYEVDDGLRLAALKTWQNAQRQKYQSEEIEDIFEFIYVTKDNAGQNIELVRRCSKAIATGSVRSNLYKDLRALAPDQSEEIFKDAALTAALMEDLKIKAAQKLGAVKVMLQIETTEKGFVKISAVLPLPKAAVSKTPTKAKAQPQTHIVPIDAPAPDAFDLDELPDFMG